MTGLSKLFKFGQWPIMYKTMVTTFSIVALILGSATLVYTHMLRTQMRAEVGGRFAARADARMSYIASVLVEQLTLLRSIALDSTLTGAVQAVNADYTDNAIAIQIALLETDRRWRVVADDSPVVQARINPVRNPAAAQLLVYRRAFPAHGEIFITDSYGGLVAATGRLSDYYQGDKDWWQAAYNNGRGAFYIGQPAYDESAGYVVLTMAAPIYSGGAVIGILRSTFNVNSFANVFETMPEEQLSVMLTNDQRLILAGSDSGSVGQSAPPSWRLYTGSSGALWFEDNALTGEPLVIGRAALRDTLITELALARPIHTLNWYLFVSQTQTTAYTPMRSSYWTIAGVAALLLLAAAAAAWVMARVLSAPVTQLHALLRRWLDGERTHRARSRWPDETGEVAAAFNTLAANMEEMDAALSLRTAEREREERRRIYELEITTAVGEVASATTDMTALAQAVVNLLCERYSLYYAGLYLLDDARNWLMLHAGSGALTQLMLAQDYRVAVGEWVVGRCVADGKTIIAYDTDIDSALLFDRAQLPSSCAAIALPLRSRGRILGALEVHSDQPGILDAESAVVLQTVADQVAVGIDSVRLFAERQEATESLQRAYGEVTREAWEALLLGRAAGPAGYQAEVRRVTPLAATPPEAWSPAARAAWSAGQTVVESAAAAPAPDGSVASLALPIRLRDEVLGVVDVSKRGDAGAWKPDEIAQLEQLVGQLGLTLEVSRFYQESRRAAAREQLLREVSERIREAVDVDTVMRIAAQEVGAVLKRPVFVYLEHEAGAEGRNGDEE
jgi:GAF domain-containing protein/HAMP domain-containing protein